MNCIRLDIRVPTREGPYQTGKIPFFFKSPDIGFFSVDQVEQHRDHILEVRHPFCKVIGMNTKECCDRVGDEIRKKRAHGELGKDKD